MFTFKPCVPPLCKTLTMISEELLNVMCAIFKELVFCYTQLGVHFVTELANNLDFALICQTTFKVLNTIKQKSISYFMTLALDSNSNIIEMI